VCAAAEGMFARSVDAVSKGWQQVCKLPLPTTPARTTPCSVRCTLCAVQQHKEQRRREQDYARADLVRCASPAAATARICPASA